MAKEKRIISADDRLKALALATIAKEKVCEADAFSSQLFDLLDADKHGHFSDLIYGRDGPLTVRDFDECLEREGFIQQTKEAPDE